MVEGMQMLHVYVILVNIYMHFGPPGLYREYSTCTVQCLFLVAQSSICMTFYRFSYNYMIHINCNCFCVDSK